MSVDISPTDSPIGVIVTGFHPLLAGDSDTRAVQRAFVDHGLLVFPGMNLNVQSHMAMGRVFGEPADPHAIESLRHKTEPSIRVLMANNGRPAVADDPEADKIVGLVPWHMDHLYDGRPWRGAVLRAITIPAEGGASGWIDTARTYKMLPRDVKEKIQGLRIIHSFETSYPRQSLVDGPSEILPETSHPLVWVHPENDLPVLAISPLTSKEIVGLPEQEGRELLDYLIAHVSREEEAYIHHWELGDVVVWDNWRMLHSALGHKKRYPSIMNSFQIKSTLKLGEVVRDRALEEVS